MRESVRRIQVRDPERRVQVPAFQAVRDRWFRVGREPARRSRIEPRGRGVVGVGRSHAQSRQNRRQWSKPSQFGKGGSGGQREPGRDGAEEGSDDVVVGLGQGGEGRGRVHPVVGVVLAVLFLHSIF